MTSLGARDLDDSSEEIQSWSGGAQIRDQVRVVCREMWLARSSSKFGDIYSNLFERM